MSNKYIRSFMTLEPFEQFNVPKGKVVIEAKNDKCEILIWVQNLLKDKFYDFYLVYRKLSKSYCVFITSIFTDGAGNSQLKYSFKTKDALSNNFNIENFDAVIISSSKKGETTIPLIGFKSDIFKLDKNELIFHKMQSNNKIQPLKDEDIKDKIEEDIQEIQVPEPKSEKNTELKMPSKLKDEFKLNKLQQVHKKDQNKIDQLNKSSYNFNQFVKNYIKNITNTTNTTELSPKTFNLESNTDNEIKPFQKQNRDVKWKKIDNLNYVSNKNLEKVLSNKLVLDAFSKYEHFLLGYVHDTNGKDYYFGVPDNYCELNKSKMLKLGFFQFKCLENIKPVNNALGYWLIKIN